MANPYPGGYPQPGSTPINYNNTNGITHHGDQQQHNIPMVQRQPLNNPIYSQNQMQSNPNVNQDRIKQNSAFQPPPSSIHENVHKNFEHSNGHPSPLSHRPPTSENISSSSMYNVRQPHMNAGSIGTPPPSNSIQSQIHMNTAGPMGTPPPLNLNQPQVHMNASSIRTPPPPHSNLHTNLTTNTFSQPLPTSNAYNPVQSYAGSIQALTSQRFPSYTSGPLAPPPLPGQTYTPPHQHVLPPPTSMGAGPTTPGSMPNMTAPPSMTPMPSGQPPSPMIHQQPNRVNQQPPVHLQSQASFPPLHSGPPTHVNQVPPPGQQAPFPSGQPPPGYPPNASYLQQPGMAGLTSGMGQMNMNDPNRPIDLMKEKRIIPEKKFEVKTLCFEDRRGELAPPERKNSHVDVFRSSLNAIPATEALLKKVKLPFGLVIHPFRDLSSLPVISAGTIVRCKRCRTYINPFVTFMSQRQWRCNLCFVPNEVPEEFMHHPVTKTYGEPHTRPECTNATLEFIAPQEYMVRPPQPAVYLFLLDVSHAATCTGYLQIFCGTLLEHLDHLPGDGRTKVGFITYTNTIQYYRLGEGCSQPQMLVVSDIDDVFIPTPDSLLVNLRERKELVQDLLKQLFELHSNEIAGGDTTQSALGAALQIAHKLMTPFGGRITVFQHTLPIIGPGSLKVREDSTNKKSAECLNPANDFYKKLALECSGHQIAVDFFFLNSRYVDIATLASASRFSAGDIHYYPGLHTVHNPSEADRLSRDLDRYLTRKIGFEAVMRIRCTKGIGVHTFHGNFYVRSTDLLALANINPDAGYALNLSLDEGLEHLNDVCFQAALLYTSSKGERRIRVHTICFPIVKSEMEVYNNVDLTAVVSLLSKMAVDRSVTSSIGDARDALLNAVTDPLKVYNSIMQGASLSTSNALLAPPCLSAMPVYISCLLKHPAFQVGINSRLDDRVFEMLNLKMQPAMYAMQSIYPDLYRVDDLSDEGGIMYEDHTVPQPDILPLSAEYTSQDGAYLLDTGWKFLLLVGRRCNQGFIKDVIGHPQFSNIENGMFGLPELDNPRSDLFNYFLDWLQDARPHHATIQIIRDDSQDKYMFFHYLRQDRTESSMSLQEFLMHVQQKIKT